MRRVASFSLIVAAVVLLVPELALACPVCFGNSDAPAARGMNQAILAMLGITGVVLSGFIALFVVLARRARLYRESEHEWNDDMVGSRV